MKLQENVILRTCVQQSVLDQSADHFYGTKLSAYVSTVLTPLPLLIFLIFCICALLLNLSRLTHFSANTCLLKILFCKMCETKGGCALSHFGPSIWNSLPVHIGNAATVNIFI